MFSFIYLQQQLVEYYKTYVHLLVISGNEPVVRLLLLTVVVTIIYILGPM